MRILVKTENASASTPKPDQFFCVYFPGIAPRAVCPGVELDLNFVLKVEFFFLLLMLIVFKTKHYKPVDPNGIY